MSHQFQCCDGFKRTAIIYLDETLPLRARLSMLAELLSCTDRMAAIDTQAIIAVGDMIQEVLRKQAMLDHLLFDRPLPTGIDDRDARIEKKRLADAHEEVGS